jgi:tetratricopeptide (TPR) repeat protein
MLAIALPLVSFGNDDTQQLFEKGNSAYAKAQYKQALADYQQILNAGYQSAALYFNMGNASYKDGEVTTAIWYYEKAHKLSPGDEDINFNIRFANLKTTDKVDEPQEFFLTKWWRGFILSASLNALSLTSILLVLFGSVLLII